MADTCDSNTPDNKERELFEQSCRNMNLERSEDGRYISGYTQIAWEEWPLRAARRAPAIGAVPELPDATSELLDMLGRIHPLAMDDRSDKKGREERVRRSFTRQQPLPVPDQAAIVWRWDIMHMQMDLTRLRSLSESQAAEIADLRAQLAAQSQGIEPSTEAKVAEIAALAERSSERIAALRAKYPEPAGAQPADLVAELLAAADATVERWHSRDWKQPHTRDFIDRLAAAVGALKFAPTQSGAQPQGESNAAN